MRLKRVQEYAQSLSIQQGWDSESLHTRVGYLQSEVSEAIEELKPDLVGKGDAVNTNELGHELFDILWNVAELANRYGIDLEVAAESKMMKNGNRTFSTSPARG